MECIFSIYYGDSCSSSDGKLNTNKDSSRIKSIITASQSRGDDLHLQLIQALECDENYKIKYHKNCISKYCSVKKKVSVNVQPPRKKTHSSLSPFDFKNHCIYCGKECHIEKDSIHPERWKEAHLVAVNEYFCKERKLFIPYKQHLLEICDKRNDDIGENLKLRLQGIESDLVANDVQYHKHCKTNFESKKIVHTHTEITSRDF